MWSNFGELPVDSTFADFCNVQQAMKCQWISNISSYYSIAPTRLRFSHHLPTSLVQVFSHRQRKKCGDSFEKRSKRMETIMTMECICDWQQGCITPIEMSKKRGCTVWTSSGRRAIKVCATVLLKSSKLSAFVLWKTRARPSTGG